MADAMLETNFGFFVPKLCFRKTTSYESTWVRKIELSWRTVTSLIYIYIYIYIYNLLLILKRYNLYKVLACSTTLFQLFLFCATFFQLFMFMLFIPSKTPSSQRVLGLPISILRYFLPNAYVYALYIFQNVIFPTCFRSSNWSFRHGFPSLNLLHNIILSHAFNMA